MAWTDFDYHIFGSMAAVLDPVNPLVDGSSLKIERVSGISVGAASWTPHAPLTPIAVTRGILRIYCRPDSVPSNNNSNDHFGLSCMHSVANILNTGTGYAVRVHGQNVQLIKATNGLLNSPTVLATVATPFQGGNTLVPQTLQLLWVADQEVELGGVYLRGSFSLGLTTTPTQVVEYVDAESPYWTSAQEGGFAIAAYGDTYSFDFDQHHMEGPA